MNNKSYVCKMMITVGIILCLSGCGSSGDSLYLSGVRAYNNDNLTAAVEKFEKAKEKGVRHYSELDLYTYLGSSYFELEMYDEAIVYYTKAVELDSESVERLVDLAVSYRKSGNNETAKNLYLKALEMDPEYAELNSSLGSLYILENEPEKAIYYFEKAVELDSGLAVAYGNGALAYAMTGDFEKADEFLKMAIVHGYENADTIKERIDALRDTFSRN